MMDCFAVSLLLYTVIIFSKEVQVTITFVLKPGCEHKCLTEYFYKGFMPIYMNGRESDVCICQMIPSDKNNKTYFFTRYSKQHKIPIYSAYKIESIKNNTSKKRFKWRIEKQLESNQAKNEDYKYLPYQKGHLNPKYHNQESLKRIHATFTLTNAVPLTGVANNKWYEVAERPLFVKMQKYCNFKKAKRYVIVGVIHGISAMESSPVTIPNYIWSAAYCHSNSEECLDFSFGYWMETSTLSYGGVEIDVLQQFLTNLTGSMVELFNTTSINQECSHMTLRKRIRGVCLEPVTKRRKTESHGNF